MIIELTTLKEHSSMVNSIISKAVLNLVKVLRPYDVDAMDIPVDKTYCETVQVIVRVKDNDKDNSIKFEKQLEQ